jgi:hypothetical protein
MAVAATVLFALYAGLAWVAYQAGFGLPVVLALTVAFVVVQYLLGTKLPLRSARAVELPESEGPAANTFLTKKL